MSAGCRLSVVIGTYNRVELLRAAVESILRETSTALRVHVADVGSTDGTVEYLQSIAGDTVKVLVDRPRTGPARTYNDVFKTIDTPYVAWLSDDNSVVNRGLDVAVAILDRVPQIGMVGLKVKDAKGRYKQAPYIGGISRIGILNVNQGVVRTPVLRSVGYFSEAFGFYGIDADLTAKVLFSGHDVVYTKQIALWHYRDWPRHRNSAGFADHKRKRDQALLFYDAKYGSFLARDLTWETKRAAWRSLCARLGARCNPNSSRRFLQAIPRDWHNMFNGRFISLFDAAVHFRRDYHLRQHVGPRQRPSLLPHDPVEAVPMTGVSPPLSAEK